VGVDNHGSCPHQVRQLELELEAEPQQRQSIQATRLKTLLLSSIVNIENSQIVGKKVERQLQPSHIPSRFAWPAQRTTYLPYNCSQLTYAPHTFSRILVQPSHLPSQLSQTVQSQPQHPPSHSYPPAAILAQHRHARLPADRAHTKISFQVCRCRGHLRRAVPVNSVTDQ